MFKQERLLIKIAEMSYLENKTQSQISKELGIHRSTISRLLKQTRESGIVEINIKYDTAGNYSIEKVLEKSFGLQKARINWQQYFKETKEHFISSSFRKLYRNVTIG